MKRARRVAISLAFLLAPVPLDALAHAAGESAWTLDPRVTLPLMVAAALYATGIARILRRTIARELHIRRLAWFVLGWSALALALLSPLHAAGERSFAAHMLEHEILMLVAAPLLVLSRPLGVFAWALPFDARRISGGIERNATFAAFWRVLTAPVVATSLQAITLWAWHAPIPFDAALRSSGWHVVQHLAFLASALAFWTSMLDEHRMRARPGVAIACLFATALVSGALGALMALSWSPWYAAYAELGVTPEGLSAVEDQQLAGLLMWIPGGAVHAGAALAIMLRVLRAPAGDEMSGPRRRRVPGALHSGPAHGRRGG